MTNTVPSFLTPYELRQRLGGISRSTLASRLRDRSLTPFPEPVSPAGSSLFINLEVDAYVGWLATIPADDVRPFIAWLVRREGSPASYQNAIGGERVRFDAFVAWLDEQRLTFVDFARERSAAAAA